MNTCPKVPSDHFLCSHGLLFSPFSFCCQKQGGLWALPFPFLKEKLTLAVKAVRGTVAAPADGWDPGCVWTVWTRTQRWAQSDPHGQQPLGDCVCSCVAQSQVLLEMMPVADSLKNRGLVPTSPHTSSVILGKLREV